MRNMFPSQEKNVKKKFQKPNILRKRSKTPIKPHTHNDAIESPDKISLLSKSTLNCVSNNETRIETVEMLYSVTQPDIEPIVETDIADANHNVPEANIPSSNHTKLDLNTETFVEDSAQTKDDNMKSAEDHSNHELVNIESFFNQSAGEKYMLFDINFDPGKPIETLVVIDNESPQSGMYIEQTPNVITSMVPLAAVSSQPQETSGEQVTSAPNFPNLYSPFTPPIKFKCDFTNCTKEFRSEQKFKKHKNSHETSPRQVTVECPVKSIEADGTEKACGKLFFVRELLMKHLNEDHTLDDAVYRCDECGRRFYWASGLRAHMRAHCRRAQGVRAPDAGAGLVCGWPGCGRVFRQPCRLREHARAHTGDRPYPCQYPDCGWAFRSASKLERHARRHTGERRHACAACGRAFLRREHLRDHHARHHAPHARRRKPCSYPGCEQTFSNMSTLYLHMKKVHKKKETVAPAATTTETLYTVPDSLFVVSLAPEPEEPDISEAAATSPVCAEPEPVGAAVAMDASVVSVASATSGASAASAASVASVASGASDEDEDEWHSARTHCTWPLERAPLLAVEPADDNLLKDDDQVEPSEGSESNTFTVRSDLFLHGNVLINEDSEHMGVVGGAGDSLGADLGLLDAHPTIDLMQEELMYADTVADESSFRIFLLSGEELT